MSFAATNNLGAIHYLARRYDEDAATRIAERLRDAKLADAVVADDDVPIAGPWHRNEARMARESAADLGAHVRAHRLRTKYALLAEYLVSGSGAVRAIHGYLVDGEGRVVFAVGLNSHHREFARAKLETTADCTALLADVIAQRLGASRSRDGI